VGGDEGKSMTTDRFGAGHFRADHVGSLLRPPGLLDARHRHEAGEIGDEELRSAEDAAIATAVAMQEEAGIDVVTDGEFRRRDFRTGFVAAVDGFAMRTWDMPWRSGSGVTKVPSHTWVATARLAPRGRLAGGEAAHMLGLTTAPAGSRRCDSCPPTSWSCLAWSARRHRCLSRSMCWHGGSTTRRSSSISATWR
jgi:hypothetical protein